MSLTTYEVECAGCGKPKWPSLPERPERYVCVLCRAVPAEARQRRRQVGREKAEKRWRGRRGVVQ